MKKTVFGSFLLLTIIAAQSCSKEDIASSNNTCTKSTSSNVRSINLFDTRAISPYFNQVVANFKISQISNTYSGNTSCPSMNCTTTLLIQNTTAKKITFDYSVYFTLNLYNWNYQGVATIPASGTLDVGQISSNCGSISLGSFIVQSASITYQ